MRKSFFFKCILVASVSGVPPHAHESTLSVTGMQGMARLRQLNERIDSLEVERQTKRREGQPLDELECIATRLRDSLKALRFELQLADQKVPAPPAVLNRETLINLLIKPDKVIDWTLIGIGGIAVLTGIVACCMYFNLLARRRRKRKVSASEIRRASQRYSAAAVPASSQSPVPQTAQTGILRVAPPARIIPEPVPSAALPIQAPSVEPKTIDALIIAAQGEGMGVPEISRRYHISADQVALVLKMAKRTNRR